MKEILVEEARIQADFEKILDTWTEGITEIIGTDNEKIISKIQKYSRLIEIPEIHQIDIEKWIVVMSKLPEVITIKQVKLRRYIEMNFSEQIEQLWINLWDLDLKQTLSLSELLEKTYEIKKKFHTIKIPILPREQINVLVDFFRFINTIWTTHQDIHWKNLMISLDNYWWLHKLYIIDFWKSKSDWLPNTISKFNIKPDIDYSADDDDIEFTLIMHMDKEPKDVLDTIQTLSKLVKE